MKSPFTNGEVRTERKSRSLYYRKESFTIVYHVYVCEDTGEEFTTDELDALNIRQVHHKYREKYGIPFQDEIRQIREQYGLSAAKISEVLGLGVNVYRQYEAGEMPSVATGRLIRLAGDPAEFEKLLELNKNALEEQDYLKIKKKVAHANSGESIVEGLLKHWLLGNHYPSIQNGYRMPDLARIGNMIRYFAYHVSPFTTALNKLMFYADFGHFKKYGTAISGLRYKAIQRGPVPENYGGIYNQVANEGYVSVEEIPFENFVGDQFKASTIEPEVLESLFSPSELEMLQNVVQRFKGKTTKQIVHISHEEPAWMDNVDDYQRISFEYGFELRNID